MPRATPATDEELEARLDLVRGLIDRGLSKADIVRYAREKQTGDSPTAWNVSDRQVRRYVDTVWERFGDEAAGVNRAAHSTRTLRRLDYLYQQSMVVKDHRTALSCLVAEIKLLKLDAPGAKLDWKTAAQQAGIDPDKLYEQLFQHVASGVTPRDE